MQRQRISSNLSCNAILNQPTHFAPLQQAALFQDHASANGNPQMHQYHSHSQQTHSSQNEVQRNRRSSHQSNRNQKAVARPQQQIGSQPTSMPPPQVQQQQTITHHFSNNAKQPKPHSFDAQQQQQIQMLNKSRGAGTATPQNLPSRLQKPQQQMQQLVNNVDQMQVCDQVKSGILDAISDMESKGLVGQSLDNQIKEVSKSQEFEQITEIMRSNIESQQTENQKQMAKIWDSLGDINDELVKMCGKKKYSGAHEARGRSGVEEGTSQTLDVTEDLLSMFVRFDVQRRYFNIVSMEMLSKSFGMEQPSSLDALMKRQTKIPLDQLIKNGRNLTLEQYFQARQEFDTNPKERNEMLRDRESFLVYKNDENNDAFDSDSQQSSESEMIVTHPPETERKPEKARNPLQMFFDQYQSSSISASLEDTEDTSEQEVIPKKRQTKKKPKSRFN